MAPATLVHPVRQSFMQIAAVPESLQHLLFDRSFHLPGSKQFIGMPDNTLIKGTFSGVAGTVDRAVLAGKCIHAGRE